jgi:hypothetical protein
MQVAFPVVPRNNLGARTLLGVFADPCSGLVVCCAGRDE